MTRTVSTQYSAPYPRARDINYEETMELENYDKMVNEASTSNSKVLLPKLSLPKEKLEQTDSTNRKELVDSRTLDENC